MNKKKKSKTVDIFNKTMKRVFHLLRLHDSMLKNKSEYPTPSDMIRSAVVLSVAAMDSYFTNRYAEILIPYLKKNNSSPKIIELLEKSGLNTKVALELITMDRPYRKIRTLVDSYLAKYTTQKRHAIDELFLGFGLNNFCENIQKRSKRKTLLRSVEILVERRNSIVHDSDYNSHANLKKINHKTIYRRINDLTTFVRNAEDIILNKLKSL